MRMIFLKTSNGAGTTAELTIPVRGGAGVNLGAIGLALGVEPSTVRLNGYFLSRGADFVSSLSWDSLLFFFDARGLPAGSSLHDSIFVEGKPIALADWRSSPYAEFAGCQGFKRKITVDNETYSKKSRLFEGLSTEKHIGTMQSADDVFLSIKRRLKLSEDPSPKKRKIGECNRGLCDEAFKQPAVSANSG